MQEGYKLVPNENLKNSQRQIIKGPPWTPLVPTTMKKKRHEKEHVI